MKTVSQFIKAGQHSREKKKIESPFIPGDMPENKEAPRGLNRAFTVITVDIKKWFIIRVQQRFGNMQTT